MQGAGGATAFSFFKLGRYPYDAPFTCSNLTCLLHVLAHTSAHTHTLAAWLARRASFGRRLRGKLTCTFVCPSIRDRLIRPRTRRSLACPRLWCSSRASSHGRRTMHATLKRMASGKVRGRKQSEDVIDVTTSERTGSNPPTSSGRGGRPPIAISARRKCRFMFLTRATCW